MNINGKSSAEVRTAIVIRYVLLKTFLIGGGLCLTIIAVLIGVLIGALVQ